MEVVIPVDPVSSEVGLKLLQRYFPSAVGRLDCSFDPSCNSSPPGLHYIQQDEDGRQRLMSVRQSFCLNRNNNWVDHTKFSPPIVGSNLIYYVTEDCVEVGEVGSEQEISLVTHLCFQPVVDCVTVVDDMIRQVADLLSCLQESFSKLVRIREGLKCSPHESRAEVPTPVSTTYHGQADTAEEVGDSGDVNVESSVSKDVQSPSRRREISLSVDGREVNILVIRPKLIKKTTSK